ncbi:hypothetical protein GH5_00426 [Leishmania sp. Ghana 2012 LV757]|uniref:hypothetical protein n=1 Tax=Leishmania sp. Ghana 2012 LV757 TaxID=2803181 RepID=UPI001B43F89C|nr:hypothetical protein GH5_00426 [Leishmania sp. Ghana 2012 LV757]
MRRPSLIERYFAQCQAHHTLPRSEFVASLRDGIIDVNLAEIPLADIRHFAYAVLDIYPAPAAARSRVAPSRNPSRQRSPKKASSDRITSSRPGVTGGLSRTQFVKLHFSYNTTLPATHLPRGAASSSASAPLLCTQNEPTLRCLSEAVARTVKESASTLSSFAWCGMPLTTTAAPGRATLQQRGGGPRMPPSLTHVLPLCHRLTSLRLVGVPLSRVQFMQLTIPSLKSPAAGADGGVMWPALEEASFVRCGLTDACKGGLVHLIRAAVPVVSSSMWQRSLRGGYTSSDDRPLPWPGAGTMFPGHSATRGLKGLDVSQNPLGDETARAVATAIPGSALRYLNVSSTSITWGGGSLLASPTVLEDTAMESVDMSNTGLSEMLARSGSAAESKVLAESSVAAGFRVMMRGMGQLLILRESARSLQQRWLVHTTTAVAPQSSPTRALDRLPMKPPTRSQTHVMETGTVAPPAPATLVPSSNAGDQHSAAEATHTPAASLGPDANLYGPWWPMFASWYAAQGTISPACSAATMAKGSSAFSPRKGYVPVPVPFPVLAPMPMPYTAPGGADCPLSGAVTAATTAPHATGAEAEDNAPSPEQQASTSDPSGPRDAAPVTSEALPSAASASKGHDEGADEDLSGGLTHPDLASSQTATGTTSGSNDLVHRASEAAGDRKFLLALISRLEAYEMDIAERLEAQYQRTTTQLTSLEKDMRFRLQHIADADRKERTAAADRQAALLEALAALRTEPAAVSVDGMKEAMLAQLMHLIEAGMEKVQAALGTEGAVDKKIACTGEGKTSPLLRYSEATIHAGAVPVTDRDLVKMASERLKELGW